MGPNWLWGMWAEINAFCLAKNHKSPIKLVQKPKKMKFLYATLTTLEGSGLVYDQIHIDLCTPMDHWGPELSFGTKVAPPKWFGMAKNPQKPQKWSNFEFFWCFEPYHTTFGAISGCQMILLVNTFPTVCLTPYNDVDWIFKVEFSTFWSVCLFCYKIVKIWSLYEELLHFLLPSPQL